MIGAAFLSGEPGMLKRGEPCLETGHVKTPGFYNILLRFMPFRLLRTFEGTSKTWLGTASLPKGDLNLDEATSPVNQKMSSFPPGVSIPVGDKEIALRPSSFLGFCFSAILWFRRT